MDNGKKIIMEDKKARIAEKRMDNKADNVSKNTVKETSADEEIKKGNNE